MLIGIAYLALFLAAGLLLARWAVPDGSPAVAVPLGCGFGVSLLAALPAGFALVCGFTLRAVWLAAAGAALLCAVLIFAGRGHIRFARDPDRGAMWLCLLPVPQPQPGSRAHCRTGTAQKCPAAEYILCFGLAPLGHSVSSCVLYRVRAAQPRAQVSSTNMIFVQKASPLMPA